MRTVGDPVAEQDAPNHGSRHLPRFHTGKLVEQHHGQADPVDELVEAARCFYGQKTHPFNDDAKQDDAKYGNQRGKDGQHGSLGRILFVQSIRSRKLYTVRRRYAMGKTAPSPCLGYPGMSMPPFSPFHGYPSLFFLFPVGTLDENHATAQKIFPHYGMDTSQQPRDENKITHKNSLFLSWCILLALCFAFVSAVPAAAGPNPAKYDKAIRDMGQLQKSKKRLQREPWEKLAETFLTVYRVEKKMERALSGLVPLRRSAGSFGPLRLQCQGRPALGGPVSPARPPLSQKLAGRRQPVPGGTAAGPDPPRQGRSARTAPTDPQKIPFFQYGQRRLQLPCDALAQRKTAIAFRRQQGKQAKTA